MSLSQLQAYALTLAIEVPVLILSAAYYRIPWQRSFITGVIASTITHPLAWWFTWFINIIVFTPYPYVWFLLTELGVWLIESLILSKFLKLSFARAAMLAALANLSSASLGVLFWS